MKLRLNLKSKYFRFGLPLAIVLIPLLFYQNCGKGFNVTDGSTDLASLTQAPSIVLTAPVAVLGNQRSFSINYNVVVDPRNQLATVRCSLNSVTAACSNNAMSLTSLTDGDFIVRINATDNRGQQAQELLLTFRVDATAPVLNVSQSPAATTGATTATFAFMATDNLSAISALECALDAATYAACTSPLNLSGLAMGAHTMRIRARDAAGNTSTEYVHNWTINTIAPNLIITQRPNTFIRTQNATITFTGTLGAAAITAFECRLDNGTYSACTSPMNYSGLSQGAHTFYLRAMDSNSQPSNPVTAMWTVDTVVPATPVITANVTAQTSMTSASMQFSASDSGSGIASYQCSLDSAAFATCTSPRSLTGLSVAAHNFRVKAFDNAGNESAIATYNWTIVPPPSSTTIPATTTTMPGSSSVQLAWDPNTETNLAGYMVHVGTAAGVYTRHIDAGAVTPVAGAVNYTVTGLTPGQMYYFAVTAYDGSRVESPHSNEVSRAAP